MFTGEPTPPRDAITSANAYLGAFPVAEALNQGADIVVTGRCVDSAVTLGHVSIALGGARSGLGAGSLAGRGRVRSSGDRRQLHGLAGSCRYPS